MLSDRYVKMGTDEKINFTWTGRKATEIGFTCRSCLEKELQFPLWTD